MGLFSFYIFILGNFYGFRYYIHAALYRFTHLTQTCLPVSIPTVSLILPQRHRYPTKLTIAKTEFLTFLSLLLYYILSPVISLLISIARCMTFLVVLVYLSNIILCISPCQYIQRMCKVFRLFFHPGSHHHMSLLLQYFFL